MIAVDTNIIVRIIVGDDEAQVASALGLAASEEFFLSLTVLMETEWVLRSRYGYARADIYAALSTIGNLIPLKFETGPDAYWALDRYAEGGELADFIHIAAARPIGRFASFERRLARRAGKDTPTPVETLA